MSLPQIHSALANACLIFSLIIAGYGFLLYLRQRGIDVHITRLRRKIEPDPRNPRFLKTVWGEVYVLLPDRRAGLPSSCLRVRRIALGKTPHNAPDSQGA